MSDKNKKYYELPGSEAFKRKGEKEKISAREAADMHASIQNLIRQEIASKPGKTSEAIWTADTFAQIAHNIGIKDVRDLTRLFKRLDPSNDMKRGLYKTKTFELLRQQLSYVKLKKINSGEELFNIIRDKQQNAIVLDFKKSDKYKWSQCDDLKEGLKMISFNFLEFKNSNNNNAIEELELLSTMEASLSLDYSDLAKKDILIFYAKIPAFNQPSKDVLERLRKEIDDEILEIDASYFIVYKHHIDDEDRENTTHLKVPWERLLWHKR